MISRCIAPSLLLAICLILNSSKAAHSKPLIEQAMDRLNSNPPVSEESFEFIVIGDSRSSKPVGLPEAFKKMIGEFNILGPAFVIDCGDLILGGAAEGLAPQWDEFEEVVSHCEVPFFPVTGNHDISDEATEQIWKERLGPTQYSFRVGNSLFIALNSEEVNALDRISDEQVEWVNNLLANTDAEHVFCFMHKPYFAQDWDENWANMAEAFRDHPVKMVFGSDIHLYRNCGIKEGVQYVITGGGGAPIHTPEEEGGFHHYLLVRVRGEKVSWSVIRPGSVLPPDVVTADRVEEIRAIRQRWVGSEPVEVPYGEGLDREVKALIHNPYDTEFSSTLSWEVPEGWSVEPKEKAYTAQAEATTELVFHVRADNPESVRFPAPSLHTVFEKAKHGGPVEVDREMSLVPTTVAQRAPGPVKIDGILDDWEGADPIALTYAESFDKKAKEDLESQIRFQWSPGYFYLAVETWDDEFYQPYAGDIVWLADNVELFLDTWSWGLSLTEKGPEVFLYWGVNRSRETVNTEVQLGVQRDGRKTVYEAAFPQDVVLPFQLEAGNSCRFSMIMNDLDGSVPDRPRHWLELTPGAGSGSGRFPRTKVILGR
ncbi:MAG: metallophosphoesterase [Candidatus Omnitrophica bacterium]|nr:metallophosphoesterase [Candidatus Omnitrophota bacterium]MCB9784011.1 metallophosphoesterase [Candidatus Omnitrophota bacterium]